jgi:VCBS repeat-containing protein
MSDITATIQGTILTPSPSGFDSLYVTSPSVTLVGGTYYMLYGGLSPDSDAFEIGLATSTDGVTWTKSTSNPVITNAGSPAWDSYREVPVTLMYDAGTYELWFNGDNLDLNYSPGRTDGFGYATSTVPGATQWVENPNPIRNDLASVGGYNLDEMVKFKGKFQAYYVRNPPVGISEPGTLYTAISTDGVTFTGDTPVQVQGVTGYSLLAATTISVGGQDTILSVWSAPDGTDYYGTSTDGTNFTIGGKITFASNFAVSDLMVVNNQMVFYGDVVPHPGEVDIAEATAPLPAELATQPPIANPDRAMVQQGKVFSSDVRGVLANDSDPAGYPLSVSAVNGNDANVGNPIPGTYGTLTLNANGSYTYRANHLGAAASQGIVHDVFTYTADDGHGLSASSTLDIGVSVFPAVHGSGIDYRYHTASDPLSATDIAKNFDFVGEYIGNSDPATNGDPSYLTLEKANHYINDAHLQIFSIYEKAGMDHAPYYTGIGTNSAYNKGLADGAAAYQAALSDGQGSSPGSAIYFGTEVPTDATSTTLLADITNYFKGVRQAFTANGPSLFTIGVYGYGATDSTIKGAGLAQYSWLPGSPAAAEGYTDWNIRQVFDIGVHSAKGNYVGIGNYAKLFPSTPVNNLLPKNALTYIASDITNGQYFGEWGSKTSPPVLVPTA